MNKKIIISVGAIALIVSSLVAFSPDCGLKEGKKASCKQENMMQNKSQMRGHGLVKMFMQLDLSDAQRVEIKTILRTNMQNMPSPKNAFTENSFNKKEFINLAKQRRDGKIESKAQIIESIYSILNASQKKALKNMLDMKQSRRMKMMSC